MTAQREWGVGTLVGGMGRSGQAEKRGRRKAGQGQGLEVEQTGFDSDLYREAVSFNVRLTYCLRGDQLARCRDIRGQATTRAAAAPPPPIPFGT